MHLLGIRYDFVIVAIIISGVFSASDMIDTLDQFLGKTFAGIQLTATYTFSLGQDYPPIDQDVTFWCISPGRRNLTQTFLNDPYIRNKVNFIYPINFLIHGWLGGLNGGNMYLSSDIDMTPSDGWMRSTAISWSRYTKSNVCAVDWSRLANYDYSVAALKNTKLVTDFLLAFIDFLVVNGINLKKVSIAGHSLGAQIAGFVGAQYKGILNAIYGLDPAGPGFTVPFDLGAGTRLDLTDARYVQCIHTARATLGTMKDCGHADFTLNGGFIQPGCISPTCSHSRSHEYFSEATNPNNLFIGTRCTGSVGQFFTRILQMPCSNVRDLLGIYAQRIPGDFFLKTKAAPPYALIIR